jgi:uncharacterized protein (TIGR02453 family)
MTEHTLRFTPRSFELLEELDQNNTKEWFAQHRDEFQMQVREPFAAVLEDLTERLSGTDIALKGGADTMFRQARDVRFSPDKRPYSVTVSGLLTPTGTKNEGGRLAYVELTADGGRIGGGMHGSSNSSPCARSRHPHGSTAASPNAPPRQSWPSRPSTSSSSPRPDRTRG